MGLKTGVAAGLATSIMLLLLSLGVKQETRTVSIQARPDTVVTADSLRKDYPGIVSEIENQARATSEITADMLKKNHPGVVEQLMAGCPKPSPGGEVGEQDCPKEATAVEVKEPDCPKEATAVALTIDGLKKTHAALVEEIELAHAPFRFTQIWGDQKLVFQQQHFFQGPKKQVRDWNDQAKVQRIITQALESRDNRLERYLSQRGKVLPELWAQAKSIARNNTIILMAFNHGELNLFINWVCSCKMHHLNIDHLLVYAADAKLKKVLDEMGISNFHLPELFGNFKETTSRAFGNHEWLEFGQLKMLITKPLLDGGFNVLFQDVDMIWFKDPIANTVSDETIEGNDMVFQHVGFPRWTFSPVEANSGFFYMRGNAFSRWCWDRMFYGHETIGLWSTSQQLSLNHHLGLCQAIYDVKVATYDRLTYPSGWVTQNKTLLEIISNRAELLALDTMQKANTLSEWQTEFLKSPRSKQAAYRADAENLVVYHTNWTPNTVEKFTKNKGMRLWYLDDDVYHTTDLGGRFASSGSKDVTSLCRAPHPAETAIQGTVAHVQNLSQI